MDGDDDDSGIRWDINIYKVYGYIYIYIYDYAVTWLKMCNV